MDMSTALTDAPPPTVALTADLARILARINRGLRHRTRDARDALEVTPSESELLRLLDQKPGIRVQDAAVEMDIASNSVSTLVKQLSRVGLLTREADPLDGRAVCLRLTPLAQEWVTRVGNAREQAIDRALASLEPADRESLESAVPALKRLSKAISGRAASVSAQ
jgi:DNA-binding MarR family transcriptional regulator